MARVYITKEEQRQLYRIMDKKKKLSHKEYRQQLADVLCADIKRADQIGDALLAREDFSIITL